MKNLATAGHFRGFHITTSGFSSTWPNLDDSNRGEYSLKRKQSFASCLHKQKFLLYKKSIKSKLRKNRGREATKILHSFTQKRPGLA